MKTAWIGALGDRVEVSGVVTHEKVYDTKWGIQHHVHIANADGALVLWRASRDLLVRPGDPITVRATVGHHRWIDGDTYIEVSKGRVLEDSLALF